MKTVERTGICQMFSKSAKHSESPLRGTNPRRGKYSPNITRTMKQQ